MSRVRVKVGAVVGVVGLGPTVHVIYVADTVSTGQSMPSMVTRGVPASR